MPARRAQATASREERAKTAWEPAGFAYSISLQIQEIGAPDRVYAPYGRVERPDVSVTVAPEQ
jgi:hypothetical protein